MKRYQKILIISLVVLVSALLLAISMRTVSAEEKAQYVSLLRKQVKVL